MTRLFFALAVLLLAGCDCGHRQQLGSSGLAEVDTVDDSANGVRCYLYRGGAGISCVRLGGGATP